MSSSTSAPTSTTFGRGMLRHWLLDPSLAYLNHGTVGAVPRVVLDAQRAVTERVEREPARFLIRELADVKQFEMKGPSHMRAALAPIAEFLHARLDDLAFVDNATTGCNAVLRSFEFKAGDEILVTNHGYGAVTKTAEYVASRTGARVVTVDLPYPDTTAHGIRDAIIAALGANTRMLVLDHIAAGSALVFPVTEVAAACRARGIATLIDGAHAPGMLDLDIPSLGVDYYTGNLHKWAMTPRSCAVLWTTPERQAALHPAVISWGYRAGMPAEFDLVGTRDPAPFLAAPAGLEFLRSLGIDAMRRYNHELVWRAATHFTQEWGTSLPAPESMYGSMVTVPLPTAYRPEIAAALKSALLYEDRVETQIFGFEGRTWVRLAAQVYNEWSDFERLFAGIAKRRP